jgi:hypothetical protein
MQKNSKTMVGLIFFVLVLMLLTAALTATGMLSSNPIQSFLVLLCFGVIGVAVLARGIDDPSSRDLSEGHAPHTPIPMIPNVPGHSFRGTAKRAHPTKVRLRVERWESERRAAVEEPLRKALRRAHSHVCPRCGSSAGKICACRYHSRY